MKATKNVVVGQCYIVVFDGVPIQVIARENSFEGEGRSFARTCPAYEHPPCPPAPPATVKVKIKKLRAILRRADELQANISAVAKGTMRVTFGEHFHMEVEDSSATAIRETLLHKLGRELNDLLTLRADPADVGASEEA